MKIIPLTWQETLPIRQQVLWPNKPIEFCQVEGDLEASHYGVLYQKKLVCVASIYIDDNSARLRKFATIADLQGKGIGSTMMRHLFQSLKEQGIQHLWLDARVSASLFYKKFDFESNEQVFYKNNVAYYKMEKML